MAEKTRRFYLGTNDTAVLTQLRRDMLSQFKSLPILGEYIHRDAFDMALQYGKDMFYIIKHAGTANLPKMFDLKAKADRFAQQMPVLPPHFSDRALQFVSQYLPQHLPQNYWIIASSLNIISSSKWVAMA